MPHDWPIAIRFTPDQTVGQGTVYIGPDNGWHHGWLGDVRGQAPHPSGLAPVYKGRISEYSGAFGEAMFGKRLIIDLADVVWNELDLLWCDRSDIIPGDVVFRACAEKIHQAVLASKGVDQEVLVYASEFYQSVVQQQRIDREKRGT